jgi:hypothetical protein
MGRGASTGVAGGAVATRLSGRGGAGVGSTVAGAVRGEAFGVVERVASRAGAEARRVLVVARSRSTGRGAGSAAGGTTASVSVTAGAAFEALAGVGLEAA